MLLRDLLRPRGKAHCFDACSVQLRDGKSFYAERRVGDQIFRAFLNKRPLMQGEQYICRSGHRIHHRCDDELAAQAVLDHYIAEYGLPEKVT